MKKSLSIVLPVYNEAENIEEVIGKIELFLESYNKIFQNYEIIIVDDGSIDDTPKILKEMSLPYLKVITHNENIGYGRSMASGIKASRYPTLLLMDADRQFDISEINKLIPYIDNYSIVTGYRHKRKDKFYRNILGKVYNLLVFLIFGLDLKDVNCGFKLVNKEILNGLDLHCHAGVFYTEIFLKSKSNGHKIKEVAIEHFPRIKGRQKGVNLKVIYNAVLDLVRLGSL